MKRIVLLVLLAACGDDSSSQPRDAAPQRDAGPDAGCFAGTPTTHEEIINACTPDSVSKVFKDPHLPLLNDDGSLPPLPP